MPSTALNPLSVPLVTVISDAAKPVTFSLKVTVIGIDVNPVGLVALEVMR